MSAPCYCEHRDCNCTPDVVAAIEALIPDTSAGSVGSAATAATPVQVVKSRVTPLTDEAAQDLAREAHHHAPAVWCPTCETFAKLLMAVDTASRLQARTADADLLGDVLNLLAEVSEWADAEADVIDGPGGEDGADLLPNRAMRIQGALDDNDGWDHGGRGLLTRVQMAWEASK